MFAKLIFFFLSFVALLAAAAPGGLAAADGPSQCNTGPISCCNSAQDARNLSSSDLNLITGLGIIIEDLTGLIGLGCSSPSLISVGGGSKCGASPLCCENNTFNGLIAIGCVEIEINIL